MPHVCHAVDNIVDTWVRYKCAAEVRLCAARAVHVRHTFTVSAHVRSRLEKLRHLASIRLACRVRSGIMSIVLFQANILLHIHPISST